MKNFEKDLNNYLSFIRKYNKDIQHFNLNKDYYYNPVINNEEEDFFNKKKQNDTEKDFVKSIF